MDDDGKSYGVTEVDCTEGDTRLEVPLEHKGKTGNAGANAASERMIKRRKKGSMKGEK